MESGKQIRIKTSKKSTEGHDFKSPSSFEVIVAGTKQDPSWELMPVRAFDHDNLPYDINTNRRTYSMMLKEGEYEYLEKNEEINKVASFSMHPNDDTDEEPNMVSRALNEMYSEEDFSINPDGFVSKKAGKECDEEDESKEEDKSEEMEKESAKETNRLTSSDENVSQNFNDKVIGGGVEDVYSEDLSNHDTPTNLLGKINQLKTMSEKLKNSLSEDDKISEDMNTDVSGSGKTEDCYSESTESKPADKVKNFQFGEI